MRNHSILTFLLLATVSHVMGRAAGQQIIRTNQPGWTITWEGRVDFIAPQRTPVPVQTNQFLNFGDALHTLSLSRAVVRLEDLSQLSMRDLTRLEIAAPTDATNPPTLHIAEGEVYLTSRGGPRAMRFTTPQVTGTPKGTEFVIAVNAQTTTITMFDGEVVLQTPADPEPVPVGSGSQGIARRGQPTEVRSVLKAQNIVQWWIYYPGIVDPDEISLTPAEQTTLAASLTAYRTGDITQALHLYPDPIPADPGSDAQRIYLATLYLAVGAADRTEAQLSKASNTNAPLIAALRTMIAAVAPPLTNSSSAGPDPPLIAPTSKSASSLLAVSYAHQSTNNLESALASARAAASNSPNFGFAWARVADLEFGHGRTRAARMAVGRALELSPRNAQAHTVHGFLLADAHKIREAIAAFNTAITIDPVLGNAWLGRGLCKRRLGLELFGMGDSNEWQQDLQAAAILEPSRSLVRSYAGKAFADAGNTRLAHKELQFATQQDTNDPTPLLYSALLKYQENRPNEAVRDLDRSIELNDNRAVYRSRLLLDQDQAVRSASLAKIYQDAGLEEVALSEAARAVAYDYSSHSAHQFLAESYNALRDPTRFNLRYESVWFNELLLANILSPVGAGLLSQNISQQEYSRLFEADQFGLLSSTEYRSDGQFREIASHYGLLRRTAYTLDLDYQHNSGTRPNNDLDRIEWYSQFKHQVTDRDSLFVLVKYQDYESGDNFQHYEPTNSSRTLRVEERQAPIVLASAHREWAPGLHTTLLTGRLQSDVTARGEAGVYEFWTNNPPPGINNIGTQRFADESLDGRFSAWIMELNQIWENEWNLLVLGGRVQAGELDVVSIIDDQTNSTVLANYPVPIRTRSRDDFRRWSVYAYDTWEVLPRFSLTAGLSYDRIDYVENFRFPPFSEGGTSRDQVSPKLAFQWETAPGVYLRGIHAQSLGGLSYEESVRLEPTQLAGFSQSFRSLISEAEAGSVVVPRHEVNGLALDLKLSRNTFANVSAHRLESDVDQDIGVFLTDSGLGPPPRAVVSATREKLHYTEKRLGLTLDQLIGQHWSLGAGYSLTDSEMSWAYPGIDAGATGNPSRTEAARLHEIGLRAGCHHKSGIFARAESRWYVQDNIGYAGTRTDDSLHELDLWVGWRFLRRRAELLVGCLNAFDQDYRLNSLTPYPDLPRERTWLGRIKVNF